MTRGSFVISCVEGDGVGPELFSAARSVLGTISETFGLSFKYVDAPMGDKEQKRSGRALPKKSFESIRGSDACLKAPVGESAKDSILKIRQELELYANIRPVKNLPFIESKFSGIDLVIVRENTEDLYSGKEAVSQNGERVTALKVVTRRASKRIAKYAFDLAITRRRTTGANRNTQQPSVVCVTKSNVLPKSDGLFQRSCLEVSKAYRSSVNFSHMYVDAAAMNLIRNPEAFDVIVTMNMYGDILSDEASQLVGSLGVAPSANIGSDFALFEPVHGAAPDIAGKGISNPIAMLLSVKMMLDWLGAKRNSPNCVRASDALLNAIVFTGQRGVCTPDIGGSSSTNEVAKAVCEEIKKSIPLLLQEPRS